MITVDEKVEYWLKLADEDVSVASILLNNNKLLQAGFFCHLIVEKALKAVIASVTNEQPPKIHALRKLAEFGNIYEELSKEQLLLFDELMPLHVEGRYADYKEQVAKKLNVEKCTKILNETEEFLCWIKAKLEK